MIMTCEAGAYQPVYESQKTKSRRSVEGGNRKCVAPGPISMFLGSLESSGKPREEYLKISGTALSEFPRKLSLKWRSGVTL